MMKCYRDLEIYKIAFDLALVVHSMTMKLPKYELYEQGSQIRRSSKSIKDNIAEGYGRSKYKNDWVKYLIYSLSSCDECTSQLEMIKQIHKIDEVEGLLKEYYHLGRKINKFILYVQQHWR